MFWVGLWSKMEIVGEDDMEGVPCHIRATTVGQTPFLAVKYGQPEMASDQHRSIKYLVAERRVSRFPSLERGFDSRRSLSWKRPGRGALWGLQPFDRVTFERTGRLRTRGVVHSGWSEKTQVDTGFRRSRWSITAVCVVARQWHATGRPFHGRAGPRRSNGSMTERHAG